MNTLEYLKSKYDGFIGVPYEYMKQETLEEKTSVPKGAITKAYTRWFVSFEWLSERVEFLNSK